MAPTLSFSQYRAEDGSNTKRRIQVRYTGPASYVAGGDPFLPADVKLGQIHVVGAAGGVLAWNGSAVRLVVWDPVNQKMVWYIPNTGAEVAGAQDLSAFVADIEIIGL